MPHVYRDRDRRHTGDTPETETHRDTQRHTERHTERERETHRETHRETQRERERQRQRDRETERQRDRETERERERATERARERQSEWRQVFSRSGASHVLAQCPKWLSLLVHWSDKPVTQSHGSRNFSRTSGWENQNTLAQQRSFVHHTAALMASTATTTCTALHVRVKGGCTAEPLHPTR